MKLLSSVVMLVLAVAVPAYCDSKSIARQEIPVELRASDPEIRSLIDDSADKWDSGDSEGALQIAKKAWDLCQSSRLESDLPIAGLQLSALFISKGALDAGRDLLNKSLEAAAERSNVVLEAQILIGLASFRELSGDRKGALETNTRALQKAQLGKSLYVQARAFGELGRMWLAAGILKDARSSLRAALDIDKANHYSLEALHEVYWVYSLLMESDKNLPTAIKVLEDALQLAKATGNRYAAFSAENALGAAYIYQGDLKRGLELLDVQSDNSILLDFSRLEMLAFAYQAGHLPDKSAETWNALLDKAKSAGNQYFIAEAAQKLGDIHRDKHEPEAAFEYYETAARSLRAVANKTALLQVLTSEIPILQVAKQDDRAPQLYAETLELVQEQKGRASDNFQFVLYLGWSFFYKQQKDWTKEIDNLEKAERLSTLSFADSPQDESHTKTVMAMWIDHAVAADQVHLPYVSVLALEQAFQCALQLKDEKAQGTVMSAIVGAEQRLGEYGNLRDVCDSGKMQSCLEGALSLNTLELLNEQWRDKWQAEQGLAVSKLTALPEQRRSYSSRNAKR
jgi:tetratricopeptide (TPR) repeat protein